MKCHCTADGYCTVFGREMRGRLREICQGSVLTSEACEIYREHWINDAVVKGFMPLPCDQRGEILGSRMQKVESKDCGMCAPRGAEIPIFGCAIHGQCSLRPWQLGQKETVCDGCPDRINGIKSS